MSGDYSRFTFDPRDYFAAVCMQQGRVALDADWNELVALLERRLRAETVDIMGRAIVPRETDDAFRIRLAGSGTSRTLTIGRGRMYVDGLLAENHGKAAWLTQQPETEPDPATLPVLDLARGRDGRPVGVMAEEIGTAVLDYGTQPYYFARYEPLPTSAGPHLVYLDVWQRELTSLERPDLLELALGGVDTTTRWQTVWQVKVLPDIGAGASCASAEADIRGWLDLTAPAAGRLTTVPIDVDEDDEQCTVKPDGQYRGPENQLYRIEIHGGGGLGRATFKWSRENASVAVAVEKITGADRLRLASLGRDETLGLGVGHWIEVTDDHRVLHGQPGEVRRIVEVDADAREIVLDSDLPVAADALTSFENDENRLKQRRTRVIRWDQKDGVTGDGVVQIPADGGPVALEKGIAVTFSLAPTGGLFRPLDYWAFPARSADASFERLYKAPPRGVHHHYARLSVITLPSGADDCRDHWPPEAQASKHEGCGCTVCVTSQTHNGGSLTLQRAVDMVGGKGGTICLEAGRYDVKDPLNIAGGASLRIVGQGPRTELVFAGGTAGIIIQKSSSIRLEDLRAVIGKGAGVMVMDSRAVMLRRLELEANSGAAVALAGAIDGLEIDANTLTGDAGVFAGDDSLLAGAVSISNNTVNCGANGLRLTAKKVGRGVIRLCRNRVRGGTQGAIVVLGAEAEDADIEIEGNRIWATRSAIRIGVAGAVRVANNDISGIKADTQQAGDGVMGISVSRAIRLDVESNRISRIGLDVDRIESNAYCAGIDVSGCRDVRIAGNAIVGIGPDAKPVPVIGVNVRYGPTCHVTGNAIELLASLEPDVACYGLQAIEDADPSYRELRHRLTVDHNAFKITARKSSAAVRINPDQARLQFPVDCILNGNDCSLLRGAGGLPVVVVAANSIVASSNRVWHVNRDLLSMMLSVVSDGRPAIVGNVTSGRISPTLGQPWELCNVIG